MKIQWTNKYSGERGYVKTIHKKEKFFENTFNKEEAKTFTVRTLEKTIKALESYCEQNTYEAV